jgi:enolase
MAATTIQSVRGRQVWDSRGRPTVEVEVSLASGAGGRAIAPAGASTGKREALDLRDGGSRLGGYGVNRALAAVAGAIAPRLSGMDAADQAAVDRAMIDLDGTPQKSKLGGNAIVATSLAVAWAAAAAARMEKWRHVRGLAGLPESAAIGLRPMIQIFGGGAHAGGRIDIQDFLVVSRSAGSFAAAVEQAAEVYFAARRQMGEAGRLAGVADEGGLWPDFSGNEEPLKCLVGAIEAAGLKPGDDIAIALDVAASGLVLGDGYRLGLDRADLDSAGMIDLLARWADAYPIVAIEDPLGEDDDAGFVAITARLGGRLAIVGDDYLVSDARRIEMAAGRGACNAALLKVNQCGTISELIAASAAARRAGWTTIMSGRSGESEDVSLSHLAFGLASDFIKVGSVARGERTAKWNEAIRIEESLGG